MIASLLSVVGATTPASANSAGQMTWPVTGPITSSIGWRTDPFTGQPKLHRGIDISVPIGTDVHAAASGTVISLQNPTQTDGGGNVMRIDVGNGWNVVYMHLSSFGGMVVGQRVTAGQIVASSGNTGASTGPHLHFQVDLNGGYYDFDNGPLGSPEYNQPIPYVFPNLPGDAPPPPPPPPALSVTTQAAAVMVTGALRIFWRDTNGNLLERTQTGSTWDAVTQLSPGIKGKPSAAVSAGGTPWVFYRGTDDQVWGGSLSGNAWLNVAARAQRAAGSPVAVAFGSGVQVFYRGDDNNLWHVWSNDGVGYFSENFAPNALEDPAVTTVDGGGIDVFWKGGDGKLWSKRWDGSRWVGTLVAGSTLSAPTTSKVGAYAHVFWTEADRTLGHAVNLGSGWTVDHPGPTQGLASAPAASSGGTSLFVHWRGVDGKMWGLNLNGTTWTVINPGPTGVDGGPISSAAGNAQGSTQVLWRGAGKLWQQFDVGATWYGSSLAGDAVA